MLGGKNRQPKQSLGYTIVEVMIVLAVSGLMFLIATNFINGKQGRASFTQGTHELASQIQNVIEQVTDGQFSDIPLICTFDGTTTSPSSGTTQNQGTNPQCVFLGKLLRFAPSGTSTYKVISLAGGRVTKDLAGNPTTPTLQNVHPAVVTTLTNSQNIPQQLTVKSVTVVDATTGATNTNSAYNFGFAEGLGTVSGDSFESGSQTIAMIYSPANLSSIGTADTAINNNVAYAKSAVMCMTDGTRFAQILIGGSSGDASQLSVNLQVVPTC